VNASTDVMLMSPGREKRNGANPSMTEFAPSTEGANSPSDQAAWPDAKPSLFQRLQFTKWRDHSKCRGSHLFHNFTPHPA